jgi:hypothetical protein
MDTKDDKGNASNLEDRMRYSNEAAEDEEKNRRFPKKWAERDDETPDISPEMATRILRHISIKEGDFLYWSMQRNMFPLIGLKLDRPAQVWHTSPSVMMIAGGAAGVTAHGHEDMRVGDSAARKMTLAHFTMYGKALILDPKCIVHAPNSYVFGLEPGGAGTVAYDPLNIDDLRDFQEGTNRKAFLVSALYPDENEFPNTTYTTGYPPMGSGKQQCFPSTHHIWAKFWDIAPSDVNPMSKHPYDRSGSVVNTTMHQDYQESYNPDAPSKPIVILAKGHWPEVDARCVARRLGRGTLTDRVPFLNRTI